jgi:hypothetical protein
MLQGIVEFVENSMISFEVHTIGSPVRFPGGIFM